VWRFKVIITGPHGFERTAAFALDEDPALVADRMKKALNE